MKRPALILTIAALGLTACTDQPVEPEPTPTATVTETVTADPAEALPSEEDIVDAIATVIEQPDPTQLPQGAAALDDFSAVLSAALPDEDTPGDEEDTDQCPAVFETQPEVAGYGTAAPDDEQTAENQEETTGLAALGFVTPASATELTDQVQHFVDTCAESGYELEPLTHHTDEAFEIRVAQSDDEITSVVLVRNTNWVYAATSTPATDVGLTLTLIDQLDEMLR